MKPECVEGWPELRDPQQVVGQGSMRAHPPGLEGVRVVPIHPSLCGKEKARVSTYLLEAASETRSVLRLILQIRVPLRTTLSS